MYTKSRFISLIILCAVALTTLFGTVRPAQAAGQCSVNAYYLYVRTGPGTQYPVTQVFAQNRGVIAFGRNADAAWISVNDGTSQLPVGWVSARFMSCNINLFALPITDSTVVPPGSVCNPYLPTRLSVGFSARITPGAPNALRTGAGRGVGNVIGYIPGGATIQILQGPQCPDGMNWWLVQYGNLTGWTSEGEYATYWIELNSAPPMQTPPPQTGRTYVVQPGDNLYRIAIRFGVNVWTLAQYNGIYNINAIYAGQRLRIP